MGHSIVRARPVERAAKGERAGGQREEEDHILDGEGQILLQKNFRSVPGIGKILAFTILCELHDIGRFPRVHDFLSYSRLVKCDQSSAGKKLGTGGAKIGNVHLEWAFSEAAALFLRNNPEGQKHLRRLAGKHGKGKALSILAAKLGRAVYLILTKERALRDGSLPGRHGLKERRWMIQPSNWGPLLDREARAEPEA